MNQPVSTTPTLPDGFRIALVAVRSVLISQEPGWPDRDHALQLIDSALHGDAGALQELNRWLDEKLLEAEVTGVAAIG